MNLRSAGGGRHPEGAMIGARHVVTLGFVGLVVAACGSPPKPKPPPPEPQTVSQRCPDMSKPEEVAAFDYAKEYVLSREAGDKLKAALLASMEINTLADKLDAEFGISCSQVAHDLGNKGDWRSGSDACAAAIKAVQEARARLGPKATLQLVARSPVCLADPSIETKCAAICDSSVPAGKSQSGCEQKAGRCDGNCDGVCEAKGGAKCEGMCTGTCEGPIRGTCGGRCVGTCDGKRVAGTCLGNCEGKCDKGAMSGECRGNCLGSCKFSKPSICDGICAGSCTVELAEMRCAGDFKPPEVSSDCRARCDLAVMNKTECSTPQAGLLVAGSKDRETTDAMKSAVDKSFPGLLKVLAELGPQGGKKVLGGQTIIEGARSGFRDLARSGGAATAAASEAQMQKCFDDALKKAAATAASVKTSIDQAIGVRDEGSGASSTAPPPGKKDEGKDRPDKK